MKRRKIFLNIISIVAVLLLLWIRSYLGNVFTLLGIVFLLLVILFAIGTTWFLHRKEWCGVLGLKTKGITGKIIIISFFGGLLISIVCDAIIQISYRIIFDEVQSSPFIEENLLKFMVMALVMAPITEELLFRGFIQGLWQKIYREKEKTPVKLIIVSTALIFAISHFGFLYNISVKQFIFNAISIFFIALYFGWLRHKYQSIIPSIFAHFGANATMVVMIPIAIIISALTPNQTNSNLRWEMEIAQYINDTIPYNFDPNDSSEWKRSYEKFAILEKPRSAEIIKHLKGDEISLPVHFTIDTCGYIHSIYIFKSTDTIWVKNSWSKARKYAADTYYIQEYGYDFSEEAIKFIKTLPQCKPYIEDGKKVEKEMKEQVQFY